MRAGRRAGEECAPTEDAAPLQGVSAPPPSSSLSRVKELLLMNPRQLDNPPHAPPHRTKPRPLYLSIYLSIHKFKVNNDELFFRPVTCRSLWQNDF